MKKNICLFILSVLLVSCKTQSNIVTSKKVAQEKGIYKYPKKNVLLTNESDKKTAEKTEKNTNLEAANFNDNKISNQPLNTQIVETAIHNIGVKYKTGGNTTEGMDCSGLVYSTFNQFNKKLPRTSNAMAKEGTVISKNSAKPGDLIFFKTNGRGIINHVGIITEITENEIKFVHSSTSKGVIISSTKETYYGNTFAQINSIIE